MKIVGPTILILILLPLAASAEQLKDLKSVHLESGIRVAQFNPLLRKPEDMPNEEETGAATPQNAPEETEEAPAEAAEPQDEEYFPEIPEIQEAPTQQEMPEPPEDVIEDDIFPEDRALPAEPPFLNDIPAAATEPMEKTTAGPKTIIIDAVVYVDYQFFGSSDAFKVKYHINMGGAANISTAIIKGDAEIATEVTGYLAKWPQGQCILDITIAKVPYEISYRQSGSDEADMNIQFKKEINEKWESTCTFIGGVTKPFKTEGQPEKWIEGALQKTSPPLSSIAAPLEADEATSITFNISEYTVLEEGLGSATVKGTGIVTIQPAGAGGEQNP